MDFNVTIRHPHLFAQLSRELGDRVQEVIEVANIVPVVQYTGCNLQPAFRTKALERDEVTSHVQVFGVAVARQLDSAAESALVKFEEASATDDDTAIAETLVDLAAVTGAMKERARQAAMQCPGDEHMAERLQAAEHMAGILNMQMGEMRKAYLSAENDVAPNTEAPALRA